MKYLFKKRLWIDIAILVVLLGITFLRYTTFKEIDLLQALYFTLTIIVGIYAGFYTLYNCKTNKQRLCLLAVYSTSLLFFFRTDALDVYIYLVLAVIFIERRETFLKAYFVSSVIFICFAIICYFFEMIPARDGFRGELPRYSLGFVHPNAIFRYFFGSLIALYIMDEKKITFNVYAISLSIPLYLLTGSRTGIICCGMFVLLSNFAIIFKTQLKKMNLNYAFLAFTLFSLGFVLLLYNNEVANTLLSGRPQLLYSILKESKSNIFLGNATFTNCDNRIIYLIVRDGVLSLIFLNVFYYLVFRKNVDTSLKIVFIMSIIYGLTENFRSLGQTIVPLLCMWSICDNYFKNKEQFVDAEKAEILTNNDNN